MYEAYWSLNEKPFENTADPRFFFASEQHEEALARILYCIREGKPAAMLSGVFGCGKTVILSVLRQRLYEERYRVAYLNNPRVDGLGLLRLIAYHLGVNAPPKDKGDILMDLDRLLQENEREGRRVVVIIDEAHSIESREVYEELRLLLNFQNAEHTLLTLVLSGQPELARNIEQNKPFEQRLSVKATLDPMDVEAVRQYVHYRLKVAGAPKPEAVFEPEALQLIYESTGGIPRRINRFCDLCLLSAMGEGQHAVTRELVGSEINSVGV